MSRTKTKKEEKRRPRKREFKRRTEEDGIGSGSGGRKVEFKRRTEEDGIGSSGGRKTELEGLGGINCVSHWFENNSRIRHETCRPGNERTWPWTDSNCGIVRDFSDENSIVATEKRREKRMA